MAKATANPYFALYQKATGASRSFEQDLWWFDQEPP